MDENVLKLCRASLPHGYQKKIAERAGVTPMSVSHFLTGRNRSVRVETAMLEVLAELRKEREVLMKEAGLNK